MDAQRSFNVVVGGTLDPYSNVPSFKGFAVLSICCSK
jgi:hypothetical protein